MFDYSEAIIGYQTAAIAALNQKINELKSAPDIVLSFDLTVPRSYEKSYTQVIRMMEMDTREEIELTADQFSCFVCDDWDWKENFAISNTRYVGRKF